MNDIAHAVQARIFNQFVRYKKKYAYVLIRNQFL